MHGELNKNAMNNNLEQLAKLIRYYSLVSTTQAGSGHPSSSLSAADLMTVLFFGGHFRTDLTNHESPNNDRLIFSKGHASPLFYSLYAAAGKVSESEMLSLRKFNSPLEGHPTLEFRYTEVPTGSLGQGLSVGVGMALNAKLENVDYRTFVLLGDSEMAEGSVWEAMAVASHYKLNNLVGIVDVNRLGQRGETMLGHNVETYKVRAESFGWDTVVIDGHNFGEIEQSYKRATHSDQKPTMVIAKTLKGKGVSFIENKDGWHGKALSADELNKALLELGTVDKKMVGEVTSPDKTEIQPPNTRAKREINLKMYDKPVSTRKAYGDALANLVDINSGVVVLDAEVSNSTFAETVKKDHPERFFEMYIAEQNMVGAATGFSRRGKIPFVSTFAAFFSRAFDQIRMSQYAKANIKFVGSHAGVSIGEDGASQMALEDIAMFRTMFDGVVLYPADAVSTQHLVQAAAAHTGNVYIRTTRKDTPILYTEKDEFLIGGSKVLTSSSHDHVTVIGAGVTLHEALAAYEELQKEGIHIRVIDLYSIKPLDIHTLTQAAHETGRIVTVEDHFIEGGIGEAVSSALALISNSKRPSEGEHVLISNLAVRKMPKSGKPDELLAYEEIDKNAIIKAVKKIISE